MESSDQALETQTDQPFVVGIGGSAGAVEALQHFFDALPAKPNGAFVVVIHLAPDETSQLTEVLQTHTALPVQQVTERTQLETNHVYVAAPGQTVLVEDDVLVPHDLEEPEERRSPIDQFFRSLSRGAVQPVGVVLSGAGTDGSVGLRVITETGGLIAAQDPNEAEHASMPRSAIETSRVDFVLPVGELARRLGEQQEVIHDLYVPQEPEALEEEQEESLLNIFEQVRLHTGHDFTEYKRSTMLRRIHRRLKVHQISTLPDYLTYLKEHPSEATALKKDFLIGVTSFFRNPEAFADLRDEVLPSLFARKDADDKIRIWAVGCATGEEAYSLAFLLLEQAAEQGLPSDQIQLFATDIDEEALATARKGRYPEPVAADVPKRYLDRFFEKEGSELVVRKLVRDRVLFTPHSLLRDPPFSDLDLICCRNLLIYLRRDLQQSVFDLFSYALKAHGYLFLGSSESADLSTDAFRPVVKSHRLYQRREGPRAVPELPSMPLAASGMEQQIPTTVGEVDREPSEAALHRRLLEAYAPPSVIVDEDYAFVHLSQTAGRYLQHPGGPPSANIVEVVRPELRVKVRSALREAFGRDEVVRTQPVSVQFDGEARSVRLVVRPAQDIPEAQGLALVVFLEEDETVEDDEGDASAVTDRDVEQLEAELEQTKKELRATIEEHETSKQEMRAANEELRSMNEEYKSMTEELETSKEELQSVNEELKTVNRELEENVQELRAANNDLKNLMASTDIGTLFLDRQLYIQRYTPRIEDLFSIQSSDTGRPIGDFTHQLEYDQLEADAQSVLDDLSVVEREVRSQDEEWFLVRHHPYRTVDEKIDGVVITFVDITRRKEAEQELRRTNEMLQNRTEQVRSLSQALTSAEETERERIGQILHDDLQQTIFAARMRVDHLRELTALDEQQADLVGRAVELLDESIEVTRTLSTELNPPMGDRSLHDALEWLAVQMEESYDLSVAFSSDTRAEMADKNLRMLLFRFVRELLFNVVKHAEVDAATLELVGTEQELRVTVADEGQGFDPATLEEKKSGFGLVNVKERMEMIGGTVSIDAAPGEGTRITIAVPRNRVLLVDE